MDATTTNPLATGVSEEHSLDFHSPYGCSKGSADQYVIDYHRIYGLRTIVFRQSCIYGYRQFGAEDQGWVAWFMIASQLGRPITIYGDGKQVRDILFIDDLLGRLRCRLRPPDKAPRKAFNIGGGPTNVVSLRELLAFIEQRSGAKMPARQRGLEARRPEGVHQRYPPRAIRTGLESRRSAARKAWGCCTTGSTRIASCS